MSNHTSDDRPDNSKIEPQPRGARHKGNKPIDQAEAAERFLAAPRHQQQHDTRLWTLRQRRDDQMWAMPEWEEMRSLASAIKEHTLSHLDTYLKMFETNAKANGVDRALGQRRSRAQCYRPGSAAASRRKDAD